jgi:hypothetical protein
MVEILDEFDGAAGTRAFAVAGDRDEVKGALNADGPGEIGKKNRGSLEYPNQKYLLTSEIAVDLRAELGNAACDRITVDQNWRMGRLVGVSNRRRHRAFSPVNLDRPTNALVAFLRRRGHAERISAGTLRQEKCSDLSSPSIAALTILVMNPRACIHIFI